MQDYFRPMLFFAIICLQTVLARVEFAQTQIYKRYNLRHPIRPVLNLQADYEGKSGENKTGAYISCMQFILIHDISNNLNKSPISNFRKYSCFGSNKKENSDKALNDDICFNEITEYSEIPEYTKRFDLEVNLFLIKNFYLNF